MTELTIPETRAELSTLRGVSSMAESSTPNSSPTA